MVPEIWTNDIARSPLPSRRRRADGPICRRRMSLVRRDERPPPELRRLELLVGVRALFVGLDSRERGVFAFLPHVVEGDVQLCRIGHDLTGLLVPGQRVRTAELGPEATP